MSLKNSIKRLYNSDLYHGSRRSKRFFEGWYFKLISADESSALALIPGVAMDENGKQHAFIQILDGKKRQAEYIKFTFESFFAQEDRFLVKIGESQFSKNEVILNHEKIKGHLTFSKTIPWPSTLFSPGIMGPFSFFPFLECYHGIVSMNHIINGGLEYKNKAYDFTNGKGYAEKDWGHSFPEAYFWMQSNHFTNDKISVKASVAKIPWLGTSFIGFIAGIWINDEIIQFTTYNFSKLKRSFADENEVKLIMENKNHYLEITASRESATSLASPIGGFMDGRINESMTDTLHVKLIDKKKDVILLDDEGRNAGVEVAGDIQQIII